MFSGSNHLKDDTLQDSLMTDICGFVKMEVEQRYCRTVWVSAEMFEIIFGNYVSISILFSHLLLIFFTLSCSVHLGRIFSHLGRMVNFPLLSSA